MFINIMASNYATQDDLKNLRADVLRLTSSISQDNIQTKSQINQILQSQKEIQQQISQYQIPNQNSDIQGDIGVGFYGKKAQEEGGPRGTGWSINNASSIAAYRASKAAVSPDYYDCTNKKVVDMYGRPLPDPANQLPYWSCPGDPSTYAIDREDYVSRLAYPDESKLEFMQVPFGLQI
jgi:hypothetical protein